MFLSHASTKSWQLPAPAYSKWRLACDGTAVARLPPRRTLQAQASSGGNGGSSAGGSMQASSHDGNSSRGGSSSSSHSSSSSPGPYELRAAAPARPEAATPPLPEVDKPGDLESMQEVRAARLAAGSWSADDEEEYRLAAMVFGGRWRL